MVIDASSPDTLGVVRNLPAGGAGAALTPAVTATQAGLDPQENLSTERSVSEANSHSPAWRLVFASSGSSRPRRSASSS